MQRARCDIAPRELRATICPVNLCPHARVGHGVAGRKHMSGNFVMVLLTAFVITVVVGDLIAIGICALIEQFSKNISLLVFLAMFVGVIPLSWRIAVRATDPDGALMRRFSKS